MTDLLYKLASAIATQEGFFSEGNTIPKDDNNPGDLRAAPWLNHPVVAGGFWKAPDLATGISGLYHQIALDVSRGMTLRQLISAWAPPSDNNRTEAYIQFVAGAVAVDPNVPLQTYLEINRL